LGESLDYETQKMWTLVTLVRDGGGLETRCHLVVNVEDANEAAPVFQQPTDDDLELLINADEPEGVYLMTVIAIDPDFNPENAHGPRMRYALTGGNSRVIRIDGESGEVFLNKSASLIGDEDKTFRVIITVCLQTRKSFTIEIAKFGNWKIKNKFVNIIYKTRLTKNFI